MTTAQVKQKKAKTVAAAKAAAEESPFPLFKDMVPYQAQLLSRLTQSDYLNRIQNTGIAPAQAYVLGELWFSDNIPQVELARRLDIGKATVGQTLTRLERAGLVKRTRTKEDRRIVLVSLTAKGRALREPLKQASIEQMEFLAHHFGQEFLANLADSLKHVNAVMLAESMQDR